MLSGDHTALRAIERSDLPQLLAWRNQRDLRRFFRQRGELSMADQLAWFERIDAERKRTRGQMGTLMFSIQRRSTSELVGVCGLCYIDWIDGTAEVSVYIGADTVYVDELLAPDACATVIDHAFDGLGLRRLWAEVYAFDERKARLFEDLGFSQEARLREHHAHAGAYHDSLLFGLLRAERHQ